MNNSTNFKTLLLKVKSIVLVLGFALIYPVSAFAEFKTNLPSDAISFSVKNDTQKKVSLNFKNKPFRMVLLSIQKQSGLNFMLNADVESAIGNVSVNLKDVSLEIALDAILKDSHYTYYITNNVITIEKKSVVNKKFASQPKVLVKGAVFDGEDKPIVGATIIEMGTSKGAITDEKGAFILNMPIGGKIEIGFSGMKTIIRTVTNAEERLVFKMEEDVLAIENVVVNGIYERKIDSFTGSASTYSQKQLKQIGGRNVLESLRTLDPSFAMIDSKKYGSDPNRLPEIELRGVTSVNTLKSEFENDPNRPLFILDGVESTLNDIVNLNMDRIESITILKDAASSAIYGSKAANGVIVVETVKPKPGQLRLAYSGQFKIDMPDLSDYNLMNAAEKLEFEYLAGYYNEGENIGGLISGQNRYNEVYKEIVRGVDTYWLAFPVRTAFNHGHNINIDGGDGVVNYGIGVSYDQQNGVMKGSDKNTIGANFTLTYRRKKVIFTNQFNTRITSSDREPVPYSEYTKQNPYFRAFNEDGTIKKYIYEPAILGAGESKILNPLYLASHPKTNTDKNNSFSNSLSIEYRPIADVMLKGRFNINNNNSNITSFVSPTHPDYDRVPDSGEKGLYEYSTSSSFTYNAAVNLVYGKIFNEMHQVNLVGGWDINESTSKGNGYSVTGFTSAEHQNPQFSAGFKQGQKPKYSKSVSRATSFYANASYSFKNRYLIDGNLRADGSSRFGSNKLFSTTWSVGLAWNIHNEKFIKDAGLISMFKIRGSMGNPGNQNFDPYLGYKTYTYNVGYRNMFGPSAIILKHGNPNLEWQRTMDRNIGFDFAIFNNRLRLSMDYYNKKTDPQLTSITMPISSGVASIDANFGGIISKGLNGTLNGVLIRRGHFNWNLNYNFRVSSDKFFNIGKTLDRLNNEAINAATPDSNGDNQLMQLIKDTDSFKRYYDGADRNDLYAVLSAGIDPATGSEVFINKEGRQVFKYDARDEVKVGNSRPSVEGIIGTSFIYKRFTASVNFRYSFGAEVMMSALYSKVESITKTDIHYNQDKRVLYDRWKNPGDIAKFSSIKNFGQWYPTPMSSRFLATENFISMESISVGYDLGGAKQLKKFGLEGASFDINMRDIFRISSIKEERGLDYPFARSISFSLRLRF